MPSTSTATSLTPQAATVHKRVVSVGDRYQTVYDDGRGRILVETRRRCRKVHCADAKESGRRRHSPNRPTNSSDSLERLSFSSSLSSPSSKVSPSRSAKASHDYSSSGRSKTTRLPVVIFAEPKMVGKSSIKKLQACSAWIELTPPPTPRLDRLETPELSDLDEEPFCDCDDKATLLTCCKSCKKEGGLSPIQN